MTHAQEVTAFIADVLLNEPTEHHAVTPYDMILNIVSWAADGVEMPEDMNAQEAADEYNRQILEEVF